MNIELKKVDLRKFYYNNLYRDYIFNFDKIRNYYQYDFRRIDSYKKRFEDISLNYNHSLRPEVCSILKKYNKSLGCSRKTIENIDALGDNKSAVVIGGQQPGLLTGPVFIIYKILTVLKVSSFLENKLKRKMVPCFWNASDDNNLEQVNNLAILNKNLENITLDLTGVKEGIKYSRIYLKTDDFKRVIDSLSNVIKPTDFKGTIVDFLNECLNAAADSSFAGDSGTSISYFFSVIISRMFSDYGLIVIDPAVEELKSLSCSLLTYDIDNHKKISSIVNDAGDKLREDGYHSQINSQTETLNFFLDLKGAREKIIEVSKGYFAAGDKRFTREGLIKHIEKNIKDISLNVIMRPLLQDSVLPVMCCICGPGEVSYFSQLKKIYDLVDVRLPIIYPRFSATIIEKRIKKVLDRFEIRDADLQLDREKLTRKIIEERLNLNLDELMAEFKNDMEESIKRIEKNISNYEMNISSSFDRIKRNIKKETSVLEKKLYSEYKKQNSYVTGSLNKVYQSLFPYNNLQERELSVWDFINKYGFDFTGSLYLKLKPLSFSHKFIEISG